MLLTNGRLVRLSIAQHKTFEERAAACDGCLKSLGVGIPTVLDSMDNSFNDTYACWPLRFYLIDGGIIEHVAQPKHGAYNPLEINAWLENKLADQ